MKKVDGKIKSLYSSLSMAEEDEYIRFDIKKSDGSSNMVEWDYLILISKKEEIDNNCSICREYIY